MIEKLQSYAFVAVISLADFELNADVAKDTLRFVSALNALLNIDPFLTNLA